MADGITVPPPSSLTGAALPKVVPITMVGDAAFLFKPHLTTQFGLVENNFQLPPIKS